MLQRTKNFTPDEFWRHVDQSDGPEDCWPWLRCKRRAGEQYGAVVWKIGGEHRMFGTHQVAFYLDKGWLPRMTAGLLIRHSCDREDCCNPRHLFSGTVLDNMQDKVRRGRCRRKETYPQGQAHAQAVLTDQQALEIRKRHTAGESQTALASAFGCNQGTISKLVRGETWKHLLGAA